ncbi:hypothetical protein H2199_004207 [Coniosporium tulheliwenetii]|uniref:Uncharacterized protein n=1 Tax=Coniosporium tulheliwenetii TaxID=3383036 RepID=A0ACC2Z7I5_9PEZI|nr:hypothetical protein H2199_004207 [Cladosporium sp. JES 115]
MESSGERIPRIPALDDDVFRVIISWLAPTRPTNMRDDVSDSDSETLSSIASMSDLDDDEDADSHAKPEVGSGTEPATGTNTGPNTGPKPALISIARYTPPRFVGPRTKLDAVSESGMFSDIEEDSRSQTLKNLSLASKGVRSLVIPTLFRTVQVLGGWGTCQRAIADLENRRDILKSIKFFSLCNPKGEMDVSAQFPRPPPRMANQSAQMLGQMSQLQGMRLQLPPDATRSFASAFKSHGLMPPKRAGSDTRLIKAAGKATHLTHFTMSEMWHAPLLKAVLAAMPGIQSLTFGARYHNRDFEVLLPILFQFEDLRLLRFEKKPYSDPVGDNPSWPWQHVSGPMSWTRYEDASEELFFRSFEGCEALEELWIGERFQVETVTQSACDNPEATSLMMNRYSKQDR